MVHLQMPPLMMKLVQFTVKGDFFRERLFSFGNLIELNLSPRDIYTSTNHLKQFFALQRITMFTVLM